MHRGRRRACGPNDLPLLAAVDGGNNRRKFVRPPGLYLDKAKLLAVESDDIDLARHSHAFRIASYRDLEVRQNDPIALGLEQLNRKEFASLAKRCHGARSVFKNGEEVVHA